MKDRYLHEYLKSPIPLLIFIFTIIISYLGGPYMKIRNSFNDFLIYELDSALLFQFAIFIIWSIFWFNKFEEDTLLEKIRYHKYFKYLTNKFKYLLYLSILTVLITLIGIFIGGIFYKVFDMPNFLYKFLDPTIVKLPYSASIKDMFGEKIIPMSILYSIFGYFFLGILYFYIINKVGKEKSKIIFIFIIVLTTQMVIAGDMSFYFHFFKWIWFIYPNYYISLPFVINNKGVYGCLFIITIEVIFILHFMFKVKYKGIRR